MKKHFFHYTGSFIKARLKSRPNEDTVINKDEIFFIKSVYRDESYSDGPDTVELVNSDVVIIVFKNYHSSVYSKMFSNFFEVLE